MADVDWDDAFDNASYIEGSQFYPPQWIADAAAFRARARGRVEIPYGAHPRERMDIFLPPGEPSGVVFFIHGGDWQSFDKSAWSHFAAGALERGWAAALPSYVLAPAARVFQMSGQIATALEKAAAEFSGPLRVVGHSSGGQLATRLLAEHSPLEPAVAERLAAVMSISGVHDLRPLLDTEMNWRIRLDPEEATLESPALLKPIFTVPVISWVGELERPEYLRQAELLKQAWPSVRIEIEPNRNHYSILEGLKTGGSPLMEALFHPARALEAPREESAAPIEEVSAPKDEERKEDGASAEAPETEAGEQVKSAEAKGDAAAAASSTK